jgi:hypothetical protein
MTEKFRADPARAREALASMEGLRDLIYGFADTFYDSLENAGEVLGHDEFGRTAGRVLQTQRLQLQQGVHALGQVADAVPHMLRSQQKYVEKSQMGVLDAIHDSGAYQGEGLPRTGGKSGKY